MIKNYLFFPAFLLKVGLTLLISSCLYHLQAAPLPMNSPKFIDINLGTTTSIDKKSQKINIAFGSARFNSIFLETTLGFLTKDLHKQNDTGFQQVQDFFYIGPRTTVKKKLNRRLFTELSFAILTGNLRYQEKKDNQSSSRNGMFLGLQPSVRLLLNIYERLALQIELDYIVTQINTEDGGLDIGPGLSGGLRFKF